MQCLSYVLLVCLTPFFLAFALFGTFHTQLHSEVTARKLSSKQQKAPADTAAQASQASYPWAVYALHRGCYRAATAASAPATPASFICTNASLTTWPVLGSEGDRVVRQQDSSLYYRVTDRQGDQKNWH